MNRRTTTVTHPAHDRLLELKLKGANHLARVLDSDAPEPTKLKAAMALARLAIPAPSSIAGSPTVREGASGEPSMGESLVSEGSSTDPLETPLPAAHVTRQVDRARPQQLAPKHAILERNSHAARSPTAVIHRDRHAALSP
ncbi:MAG: hypothetical protein ACREJO_05750 [Phycisphaerales bacterium]